MELIIKNNRDNYFEIRGMLVKQNVHLFTEKFQNAFDYNNQITISIIEIDRIDSYGVNAIAKLHNEAIVKNKQLSIIGLGNQELFNKTENKQIKLSLLEKFSNFYFMPLRRIIMPFVDA